jgi:hypothetical protein
MSGCQGLVIEQGSNFSEEKSVMLFFTCVDVAAILENGVVVFTSAPQDLFGYYFVSK